MAENIFLPVEVLFRYDDESDGDIFKIKLSNIKEKIFENRTFIQDTKKDVKDISVATTKQDELFEYANIPDYYKEQVRNKDDYDMCR